MASKREATEVKVQTFEEKLDGMSEDMQAQMLAYLSNQQTVAKKAREDHGAKVLKSATIPESERKPSKSALMAEVVAEVNTLFTSQYDDAQANVTIIVMEAMDKLGELCKAKGLDTPKKARFVPNGEESPGYKFVARGGSGSTPRFDPGVYTLSGEKATTDQEKAIVKALQEFGDYAPCAGEIKNAAGIASNSNIQTALNVVATEVRKISRGEQAKRLEAL